MALLAGVYICHARFDPKIVDVRLRTLHRRFDLLYRLASRRKYWDKLSVGGVLSYPFQLPAFLRISIQEQIKAVPFGVVPCFALIRAAGEKRSKDVRKRRDSLCIHAGKVDPFHVLSVVNKQTFPLYPGSERCEGSRIFISSFFLLFFVSPPLTGVQSSNGVAGESQSHKPYRLATVFVLIGVRPRSLHSMRKWSGCDCLGR